MKKNCVYCIFPSSGEFLNLFKPQAEEEDFVFLVFVFEAESLGANGGVCSPRAERADNDPGLCVRGEKTSLWETEASQNDTSKMFSENKHELNEAEMNFP